MRITIDGSPTWIEALRRESRGDEIQAFTPGRLLRGALKVFGSPLLDAAIRGTDVFHASPVTLCVPSRAKLTATVDDLSAWLMPGLHTEEEIRANRAFSERVLLRADGLIATSDNTRQDAMRILGAEPERITTIYPGVDAAYFDAKPTPRQRPYVLYAGGMELRKNFKALLDAWREMKPETRREYDLVVAGPMGEDAEVIYAGSVPEAEMPGLMAGATVFIYPSLYEGFAVPVAQAMAAHVAVVTSGTSSLPEVGRDAAVLVDPHSPAEIAAGMTRLLESESERAKLARYGRARAEKYRWERCAEESLRFFHRVAGR
jgi:glycosyltransferase involved in cell wall biosynthesis